MRAVIQRVSKASVSVESGTTRSIRRGLMILLGVARGDTSDDAERLASKTAALRIFEDEAGKMNLSVRDIDGEALVVSQFTLMAETAKGNRPSFDPAAPPEEAIPLYRHFVDRLEEMMGRPVPTGEFGARMRVNLVNDGPVTLLLDSRDRRKR